MTPPRITEEEWNRYKEVIRELFPKLERAQILEHLSREYGFCPTPSQYELQKKKWGLLKNKTRSDWEYIEQNVRKRKLDNKESEIIAHNSIVTSKQLKRARKWARKHSFGLPQSQDVPCEAPAGVIISTPPAEVDLYPDNNVAVRHLFQFELILDSYISQYRQHPLKEGAVIQRGPQQIEMDYLLESLCNFGFELPLHITGIDFSTYEESLLFQEEETLNHKVNNLIEESSGESVETDVLRCADEQTIAPLQKTVAKAAEGRRHYAVQSFSPGKLKQAFRLLRCTSYLSANRSLSLSQSDKLLRWALDRGHFWVVESVIAKRTPITDAFASKLLISSIRLRETEVSRKLLKNGANANEIGHGKFGPTLPIYEAIANADSVIVRLLIEHGACTNPYVPGRQSALGTCLRNLPIDYNRTEIIRVLIENGADINKKVTSTCGIYHWTLLHEITESGDLEGAKLFLNAGVLVKDCQWWCPSPLQVAAVHGHAELVELLIHFGADVNAPIGKYELDEQEALNCLKIQHQHACLTPLQIAIANGRFEVVEILLEHGANVNGFGAKVNLDKSQYNGHLNNLIEESVWSPVNDVIIAGISDYDEDSGVTLAIGMCLERTDIRDLRLASSPLQAAAASQNTALVRRLLNLGADIHAIGGFGTALHVAASRKGNIQLVKLLLNRGADVNAPACLPVGRTALQAAVELGDVETVEVLINCGADINAAPSSICGRTALQAAVETNNVKLAVRLIQLGAKVHSGASCVGQQINIKALDNLENTSMLDLLLQNGVDINGELLRRYGLLVAFEAVTSGRNLLELQKLLKLGIDADELGHFLGKKELLCGSLEQLNVLQLLIEHKMNPDLAIDSSTLMPLAIVQQDLESVQLLIKAGAEINYLPLEPCIYSQTYMQMAAARGSVPLCQVLIAAGADLKGNMGTAALLSAVKQLNIQVVKFLLSIGVDPNWEGKIRPKDGFLRGLQPPISAALSSIGERATKERQTQIELLLNHGAAVDQGIADFGGLHHLPASLIQRLYQQSLGAKSCPTLAQGMFWLQVAARQGNMDFAQQLLNEDIDLNCHLGSEGGGIALQKAVEGQHRSMVDFLLSKGANINYPANEFRGATALQRAVLVGSMPIVTLLLDRGADVNAAAARVHGRTALEAAAEHGRLGMVYMLLARDREPDTVEFRCKIAANMATSEGFPILARVLREWKVSKPSGDGTADPAAPMGATEGDYVSPSTLL